MKKYPKFYLYFLLFSFPIFCLAWVPPYGIPEPSFGINEQTPVYNETNPLHFYVNGLVACNDSNNGGRGSPSAPLCTIPTILNPGSFVAVAGLASKTTLSGINGTSGSPVWIAGIGEGLVKPAQTGPYLQINNSSYIIVDGLIFDGNGTPDTQSSSAWRIDSSNHISIRNSVVRNMVAPPYNPTRFSSGGAGAWYGSLTFITSSSANTNDIVLYKNNISNNSGGQNLDYENGRHGIQAAAPVSGSTRVERVWILDNVIYNNSEDGIQIGQTNDLADQSLTRYFYIGGNTINNNGENAIDVKASDYIVVSQNTMSGYKKTTYRIGAVSGSDGTVGVINNDGNGPIHSWWMFNTISSSRSGIRNQAGGGDHYIFGNVFFDLNKDAADTEPTSAGNNSGVAYWQSAAYSNVHILNNTMFDIHGGIYLNNVNQAEVSNNIVSNIVDNTKGWPININNSISKSISNNMYFDPEGVVRRDADAISLSDIIDINPQFVNTSSNNFSLISSSAAVNAGSSGLVEQVLNLYSTTYGLNISNDILGVSRPQGSVWDMGAYEFVGTPPTPVPPPPPAPTPTPTPTPLPGDLNLDHTVNSLDFSIMNSNWYTGNTTADLNSDGSVNSLDYAILSSNWGKTW